MDTDCKRPVRDWVPAHLLNRTNVVFGVEYDARGQEVRADMLTLAQTCQWSLMSKPDHPVIRHIVESTLTKLEELGANNTRIVAHTTDDVLDSTGPHVFTKSVLEALSLQMGRSTTETLEHRRATAVGRRPHHAHQLICIWAGTSCLWRVGQ